jgi:hypothetical protein
MPELPERTVRELIIALLDMPLDGEVEVHQPGAHRPRSVVSVSHLQSGPGLQYVALDLNDA